MYDSIKDILKISIENVNDSVVKELVNTVSENDIIMKFCGSGGSFPTSKCTQDRKSVVYVPTLTVLQKLFNRKDVLNIVMAEERLSRSLQLLLRWCVL